MGSKQNNNPNDDWGRTLRQVLLNLSISKTILAAVALIIVLVTYALLQHFGFAPPPIEALTQLLHEIVKLAPGG